MVEALQTVAGQAGNFMHVEPRMPAGWVTGNVESVSVVSEGKKWFFA
jgi:hypothetical protein